MELSLTTLAGAVLVLFVYLIAIVVLFSRKIDRLTARIKLLEAKAEAFEIRDMTRELFYKIDHNGDMQVLGSVTCHGGDRNSYNNS